MGGCMCRVTYRVTSTDEYQNHNSGYSRATARGALARNGLLRFRLKSKSAFDCLQAPLVVDGHRVDRYRYRVPTTVAVRAKDDRTARLLRGRRI